MRAIAQLWRMRGFEFAPELSEFDRQTIKLALPSTMTSPLRLQALVKSVRYVARYKIPGAVVECGVWRGGSMFAVARTLLDAGLDDRELFLFDTFSGMPSPDANDYRARDGRAAAALLSNPLQFRTRAVAGLDVVKRTMKSSNFDERRTHYVVGKVEQTVPEAAPPQIAILRLDTDWYSSTLHELEHLFSRLSRGGVLIIDDYGWWAGARKAADEFLARLEEPVLLQVIDDTGRIAIRMGVPSLQLNQGADPPMHTPSPRR